MEMARVMGETRVGKDKRETRKQSRGSYLYQHQTSASRDTPCKYNFRHISFIGDDEYSSLECCFLRFVLIGIYSNMNFRILSTLLCYNVTTTNTVTKCITEMLANILALDLTECR
jgi:hypothetical protein